MELVMTAGAVAATLAAGLSSAMCLCVKQRTYNTRDSKSACDDVNVHVQRDKWVGWDEVQFSGQTSGVARTPWLARYVLGSWCGYFALTEVHVNQYDDSQRSLVIRYYQPCCVPWSDQGFGDKDTNKDSDSNASQNSALKAVEGLSFRGRQLDRLEATGVQRKWPDWGTYREPAFPRYVEERDLCMGKALARRMLAQLALLDNSAIFAVVGPGGCGKSSAANVLALMLGATLVKYDPTTPGHTLSQVLKQCRQHDEEAPVVVVLDEFDSWMLRLNTIEAHDELVTEVRTKQDWSNWSDRIYLRKNVVVVMTSNAEDDMPDPTYLRPQRVMAHYQVQLDRRTFRVMHEFPSKTVEPGPMMTVDDDGIAATTEVCTTSPPLIEMS